MERLAGRGLSCRKGIESRCRASIMCRICFGIFSAFESPFVLFRRKRPNIEVSNHG